MDTDLNLAAYIATLRTRADAAFGDGAVNTGFALDEVITELTEMAGLTTVQPAA